jgi:stage V sporulation protein S
MQAPNGANTLDVVAEAEHLPQPEAAQQETAATSWQAPPAVDVSASSHANEVLKVSTRSRPSAVAGAIAGVMRERGSVEVQSIGAGATNQAIKAVAIAHSYLWDEGIKLCCVPTFITLTIDGDQRTGIQLLVQHQPA